MAQFHVYRNLRDPGDPDIPYLLDVQADLLTGLDTRLVAPLVRADAVRHALPRLQPAFQILGEPVVMDTPQLGAVPQSRLGPPVEDLRPRRDDVMAALDFLLLGF